MKKKQLNCIAIQREKSYLYNLILEDVLKNSWKIGNNYDKVCINTAHFFPVGKIDKDKWIHSIQARGAVSSKQEKLSQIFILKSSQIMKKILEELLTN